jgi:hypothetical protein
MAGKAVKVFITERQQEIFRPIAGAPTAASQFRQRATIIVSAFDRRGSREIAAAVGRSRRQVSPWRRRWADAWDRSIRIECTESGAPSLTGRPASWPMRSSCGASCHRGT